MDFTFDSKNNKVSDLVKMEESNEDSEDSTSYQTAMREAKSSLKRKRSFNNSVLSHLEEIPEEDEYNQRFTSCV